MCFLFGPIGRILMTYLHFIHLATLMNVVVYMHKCESPKDNHWFDYVNKLCCYENVISVRLKGQRLNALNYRYIRVTGGGGKLKINQVHWPRKKI